MAALGEEEITRRLDRLDDWALEGASIRRVFDRGDFVGAVRFVNSLVEPAEELGHHPDVSISWDKVIVSLTTHSEGRLTEADFDLAERIDALA